MNALQRCPVSGEERILDVGCGDGKIFAWMASQVPEREVMGFDLSPAMIDLASQAFRGVDPLSFVQKDGADLAYEA